MSRILGRADDMLIIRGVNVYPTQIEAALIGLEQLSPHYRLVVRREDRLDTLEVQAEVSEEYIGAVGSEHFKSHVAGNSVENIAQLEGQIHRRLREALGLNTAVSLLQPGDAPRSEGGKLSRVEDLR